MNRSILGLAAIAGLSALLAVAPAPKPSASPFPDAKAQSVTPKLSAVTGFDATIDTDTPAANGLYHFSFVARCVVNGITITNCWVATKE